MSKTLNHPKESRIALLGGSFNPPHLGHLMLCEAALAHPKVAAAWLLPVAVHPGGKLLALYEHRLQMCGLLAKTLGPTVAVSAAEAEVKPAGRTRELLRYLVATHPGACFTLVLGADTAERAPRWPGWAEIARIAPPLVFPRFDGSVPLSSTEARRRVAAGLRTEALLPYDIRRYIDVHGLYRPEAASPQPTTSTA